MAAALVMFLGLASLEAAESLPLNLGTLPEIGNLTRGDAVFDQFVRNIQVFHQALAKKQPPPPVILGIYRVKSGDTLFSISSRLNLNLGSLATINSLRNPRVGTGDVLVVPNTPGLYARKTGGNALEGEIRGRLAATEALSMVFDRGQGAEDWLVWPGADFTPQERLQFLSRFFVAPLKTYRISSRFGNRVSPLTGTLLFHPAVDLVASMGSPVYAIADGLVRQTGFDPVYGNYVIVDHEGGFRSFYAHLLRATVKADQRVEAGGSVGSLGNTGRSTGAHLHLELYKDGTAVNPEQYLDLKSD